MNKIAIHTNKGVITVSTSRPVTSDVGLEWPTYQEALKDLRTRGYIISKTELL